MVIEVGCQSPVLQVGNLAPGDFTHVTDAGPRALVAGFDRGAPGTVHNLCSVSATRIGDITSNGARARPRPRRGSGRSSALAPFRRADTFCAIPPELCQADRLAPRSVWSRSSTSFGLLAAGDSR
ncbi:MAG: hypothetical protein IPO81_19390 [Kouleothrix sp.]|nr:hypothetical protein [Kouleothrix sp.]